MKRSEAVRQIKSIIATCGPTQPTIETAEQVLARLESLGMLPPPITVSDPGHFPGDSFTYQANEWETEQTFCKDCGVETKPGRGSARCRSCWDDKVGC